MVKGICMTRVHSINDDGGGIHYSDDDNGEDGDDDVDGDDCHNISITIQNSNYFSSFYC